LKLTNFDYTQALDTDAQGKWDYARAHKRELALDATFDTVFEMVLDGKINKDEIHAETLVKHPEMRKNEFEDVW
jgi:hypothetical protein